MKDQLDGIQQTNSNYEKKQVFLFSITLLNTKFWRKSEESLDSKQKLRQAEIQNLWATYFKKNRKEQDLIKDIKALILKNKTVYYNFEKLITKGIIIYKIGSDRISRLANDLEIKINQILSDDSDFDVSEIKDELCEQEIEANQRTLKRYKKWIMSTNSQ